MIKRHYTLSKNGQTNIIHAKNARKLSIIIRITQRKRKAINHLH